MRFSSLPIHANPPVEKDPVQGGAFPDFRPAHGMRDRSGS